MKKKNPVRTGACKIFTVVLISFFLMMGFPNASPADDVEDMKKQLKTLNEMMKTLQEKRLVVMEDIKRAAADKDFKENAPYHAAREQKSMLDGKIMELDEMISTAVIIEENQNTKTVCIGSTVILQEVNSGKEVRYTLVGPREVNPAKGKISGVSPVGKAVLGKCPGDIFEVTVPSGKLQFRRRSGQ